MKRVSGVKNNDVKIIHMFSTWLVVTLAINDLLTGGTMISEEDFSHMSPNCPMNVDGDCHIQPTDFSPSESYECGCCGSEAKFTFDECNHLQCPMVYWLNLLKLGA